MDGLALLCNLFADGPVTLKRLRTARIAHLAELERTEPAELAHVLHSSVAQARSFAEESRKLARRLAEELQPSQPSAPQPSSSQARSPRPPPATPAPVPHAVSGPTSLRPGLFPGLDEALCARLLQHQVRTVQALSEFAGLALARRTGIPYSTLLTLSRSARRFEAERARGEPVRELSPFLVQPKCAPAEAELAGTDEFTLPRLESESAGPFG